MRRSHVERRSYKYAPVQYVSDTHHERRDVLPVEHNKMTRKLAELRDRIPAL